VEQIHTAVEIKRPTRCNRWFFIAKLIVCSACSGHHYAHHQELRSIIQVVAACGTWCFGLQVVGLVWSCRLCDRCAGCCSIPQTGCFRTTYQSHLQVPRIQNLFEFLALEDGTDKLSQNISMELPLYTA